ncbi:MAG TPA: hypothetical protein VLA13_09135 [Massilibacterium sp.]|nr:hypothetical protein [Massilibacterium sp.]
MKRHPKYIWYYNDYGCWIKSDGEYGKTMYPGDSFNLRLSNELIVPCHLGLNGQQLWYVELGQYKVKLNLRKNEIYEIED